MYRSYMMNGPLCGRRRRFACSCAASLLALCGGRSALALEIKVNGEARVAEEYSTNIFLNTPAPRDGAWGQGFDATGRVGAHEANWHSILSGRFNNRWYVPDSALDYANQLFDWTSAYALERARFELDTQYNLDTTLTQAADLASNVGYVFARIPKTTRVLAPAWRYALTEKSELGVHYSYQDTEYDQQKNLNGFPNTRAHTGSMELTHRWNERLKLIGTASYTDYALISQGRTATASGPLAGTLLLTQTPGSTSTIRTTSGMAGFDYALTDTLNVSLSGGAQYNQTLVPEQTLVTAVQRPNGENLLSSQRVIPALRTDSLSGVFAAKLGKHFEHSDLELDISRSISPNINGQLITYDTYSVSAHHRFSPLLSAGLSAAYAEQTFPALPNQADQTRQLISLQSSLTYQWSDHWVLTGSYQYSQIEYAQATATPNNHALSLNLQYLFDQRL